MLAPALAAAAPGVPLELHSHCLSGLAPEVYIAAIDLGVTFTPHGGQAAR